MPRAKRFFLPGFIYHITHRCHDRAFLLKYPYEKQRWMYWISCGIKKYRLKVLNYCVTNNHIHLIVHPEKSRTAIAKTMHLVAGRVGQEYNERKGRKGAFWEDRYHATAIQSQQHLLRCMHYVDLNMVRAGVVNHPAKWSFCGFAEMTTSMTSSPIINKPNLLASAGIDSWGEFIALYHKGVESALTGKGLTRDDRWTRSIAVGDRSFVEGIKEQLAHRAKFRETENESMGDDADTWILRESAASYQGSLPDDNEDDNSILWEDDGA
jgi:putative transposase